MAAPNEFAGLRVQDGALEFHGGVVSSGNGDDGIYLLSDTMDHHDIGGLILGLAADGTTPMGNEGDGLFIRSSLGNALDGLTIGGNAPADAVVSGDNDHDGIHVRGWVSDLRIEGVWAGVTPSGDPVGNGDDGIHLRANASATNYPFAGAELIGNVVGNNATLGIRVVDVSDVSLEQNGIGTDPLLLSDHGNGQGLQISGGNQSVDPVAIGAAGSEAAANYFAFNDDDAITITEDNNGHGRARDVRLHPNVWLENGALPLDLDGQNTGGGPTVGTCGDDDELGNGGLQTPAWDFAWFDPQLLAWNLGGTTCPSGTVSLYLGAVNAQQGIEPNLWILDFVAQPDGGWTANVSGGSTDRSGGCSRHTTGADPRSSRACAPMGTRTDSQRRTAAAPTATTSTTTPTRARPRAAPTWRTWTAMGRPAPTTRPAGAMTTTPR